MNTVSLKERPLGPEDFVDDSDKRWAWGLAPLTVAIIVKIAISLFGFRRRMDEFPFEQGWYFFLYRFDLVLYLFLAILALWACRTYRGASTAGAKSWPTTVGISLALITTVVMLDSISSMLYAFSWGGPSNWTIFNFRFDGYVLVQMLHVTLYTVFREASLRGVVMGSLLRNSSTPRSAILTATFLEILAAMPFILSFDVFRIVLEPSIGAATSLVMTIVLPIVMGLGLGVLRVASGRLWPCILVGLLAGIATRVF